MAPGGPSGGGQGDAQGGGDDSCALPSGVAPPPHLAMHGKGTFMSRLIREKLANRFMKESTYQRQYVKTAYNYFSQKYFWNCIKSIKSLNLVHITLWTLLCVT